MNTTNKFCSVWLLLLSVLSGMAGLVFYLSNQYGFVTVAQLPLSYFAGSIVLKKAVLGSFPSFTHALASGLLAVSLTGIGFRIKWACLTLVLLVLIGMELALGIYDVVDVYALILGVAISAAVLACCRSAGDVGNRGVVPATIIILCSATLAAGSYTQTPDCARYEGSSCVQSKRFANPKYMSYGDLRSAVKLEEPHQLQSIERLYLYKSLIFMNEKNQGIHIFDNRFPKNPEPIAFIRIPGNLDISIKGDYLYADSYVDLVTLDISDINNVSEVSRDIEIFPYDAFQNIPYDIDFEFGLIDSSRGVVVGYE